jgi:hypothetical protein
MDMERAASGRTLVKRCGWRGAVSTRTQAYKALQLKKGCWTCDEAFVVDAFVVDAFVVDAYEAISGSIFASRNMELANTFHSLDEMKCSRCKEKKKEDEPSYCWQLGSSDGALQDESNGKTLALEMFHKLRELEIKRRAHFPSPSITFGSKLSVMLAQRNLRDIHAIPMLPVRKEHVWKKQLPRSTRRRS